MPRICNISVHLQNPIYKQILQHIDTLKETHISLKADNNPDTLI